MWFRSACFLLLCLLPASARADPRTEALDRGRLSLAWDARVSGECDEALRYLTDISPAAKKAPEALRLRSECLLDLGRYRDAVEVLGSAGAAAMPDREAWLEEAFDEWAHDLTGREDYQGVRRMVAQRGSMLPQSLALRSLDEAARFRSEAKLALGPSARTVRLRTGEELRIAPLKGPRSPRGWTRAYPWLGEDTPVPRTTLAEWMPSLAAKLDGRGQGLWAHIPHAALLGALGEEARRGGLELKRARGETSVGRGSDRILVDLREWTFRAAAEGLGIRGAAAAAVAQADRELRNRALLAGWISERKGELEVMRDEDLLRIRNARSGRTYDLDLAAWAASFEPESKDWLEFWSGLVCELEEAPGRFLCSCGRPAVLREVLLPAGSSGAEGGPSVVEKGSGYELALLAVCPSYERYVNDEVLKDWGVTLAAAAEKAKADARQAPWELTFRRGDADGVPYVVFEGEGASSLVLRPELLLGALEAVEGAAVREKSITSVAPTVSSLAVLEGLDPVRPAAVRRALVRVLLDAAQAGTLTERVSYAARVRLPTRGAGAFRVRPAD
ncbi:MAG: hypothetical protein HY900_05155 [Deltaproteobacteria bacterium]|nr:hypothetical protein [Deltaproteobacteria bacterium]